jgi:uncharacterized protein YjbI with pentapeptide repeats
MSSTPPVPALTYLGKFTLAFPTGFGTFVPSLMDNGMLVMPSAQNPAMMMALYQVNGVSPATHVIQGVDPATAAVYNNRAAWFGVLEGGAGVLNTRDSDDPLWGEFQVEINGNEARFLIPEVGYLQVSIDPMPARFWIPPLGSDFDNNTWSFNLVVNPSSTAGADWRWVQLAGVTSFKEYSLSDMTGVNLDGAVLSGSQFDHTILHNASARGAVFSPRRSIFPPSQPTVLSNADLNGSHLEGAQFPECDLRGAKLTGCSFRDWSGIASFAKANLTGATFGAVTLSQVEFSGAKLRGANLSGSDLTSAKFHGADLSFADLSNAALGGADFTNATLTGTNLSGASFNLMTKFTGTMLQGVNLSGCDLRQAQFDAKPSFYTNPLSAPTDSNPLTNLSNTHLPLTLIGTSDWTWLNLAGAKIDGILPANLTDFQAQYTIFPVDFDLTSRTLDGAAFRYAKMHGALLEKATASSSNPADFTGADLTSARMAHVSLPHAKFITAILYGVSMGQSNLRYANFSSAHLETTNGLIADLSSCDLTNAIFSGAFLDTQDRLPGANLSSVVFWGSNATIDSATLSGAQFDDAFLAHVDFSGIADKSLEGASFAGACLVNCNFAGTALTDVILTRACLQGAQFSDAMLTGAHLDQAAIDFMPGKLAITGNDMLPPFIEYLSGTIITTSATDGTTKCPNSDNGPCSNGQWQSHGAPLTAWAAPPPLVEES